MYWHEDRIRALDLYIKFGKRVRATIRQLDSQSTNGTVDQLQGTRKLLAMKEASACFIFLASEMVSE